MAKPSNASARIAESRRVAQRKEKRRKILTAVGIIAAVVAVLVVLIVVKLTSHTKTTANGEPASGTISAATLSAVTQVPANAFTSVGAGTAKTQLLPLPGPPLTASGKPRILYVGAEYCPYCAAERWPMVIALSRFGTWSNLTATHSASDDAFPNTATFSFHGAKFTSQYISFESVELQSNKRSGGGYAVLETPTPEQRQLLDTYDAPPYVPASIAGSIPFVDFANTFVAATASFDPSLLKDMTVDDIAATLTQPDNQVAKAILGAANQLTAAFCRLTNSQPASVCGADPIPSLMSGLPHS